jgi:GT2 family glycosyltransferase
LRSVADLYLREKENYGYARAVNDGLRLAKTPYICISNNDVRVPEYIFDVALEIFKDKEIGSVHFNETNYDVPFKRGDKLWRTGKERWCTSSFFMLRKKALQFYDERFDGRGTYDDWDFWFRFRRRAWKTAYTTKAQYQHWGSHSFGLRGNKQRHIYDEINREYFKKKWGEHPEDIWMKLYPSQMTADYFKGFE